MAVQPQTPYKEYTANGSTKSFALEFDCDNQDHLIVLVDDMEPVVGTWSLSGGAVVFGTAPGNGKKITIQRNTPFRRDGDFQSYDNSFRPPGVNKGFDKVWWKIQELGVADWLLGLKLQKFRDEVNLTALENTLKQARDIRDTTSLLADEVQDNVTQSETLLTNTTAKANSAATSATNANTSKTQAQQAVTDANSIKTDMYTALYSFQNGAIKAYPTLAAANADIANIALDTKVEVLEIANGGSYYKATAGSTSLTKSPYDPLNYVDSNAIFNPKTVSSTTGVDLDTLNTFGFHKITSQPAWDATLNKPTGFNGPWSVILILPLSTNAFFQIFYSLNDKKIAFRVRSSASVISEWIVISGDQPLLDVINAYPIITPKSVSSVTGIDFNTLNTFGFHKFVSANAWNNSTNKPTLTDQWAFALILPISTSVIFQFVFCINANVLYFRSSTSTTAWGQWKKITGDDAVLAAAAAAATSVITNELTAFSSNILPSKIDEKLKPEFEIASKNIFDPYRIILGKTVSSTGVLLDRKNSVVTGVLNVKDKTSLAVSGLQPSTGYRAIVFKDINDAVVNVQSVGPSLTEKLFSIPSGSIYAQLCIKDSSDTFTLDTSTIQIEFSATVTVYESFKRGPLKSLYGVGMSGADAIRSRAFGASYLIFGDSITETSNVDAGVFNQFSYKKNWPTWAYETLRMGTFKNYAKSGAAFKDRSLEPRYQYLYNQVVDAIANNENPDVIVVACGTNDAMGNVGTYEAAMSKATLEELDQLKTLEAARWVFWKLRLQYPDAVCFYANPLQRMANTTEELAPLVDGLGKIAQRHGFILIDQHRESGIIRELEVLSGSGKYLADGLHPNDVGRQRQANLIVSKIISYMSY